MSATFYGIVAPFTRITISRGGGTVTVAAYVGDTAAGSLTVPEEYEGTVIRMFVDLEYRAAHRSGGRLTADRHLPDAMCVVAEYGEVTTLGDLRRDG